MDETRFVTSQRNYPLYVYQSRRLRLEPFPAAAIREKRNRNAPTPDRLLRSVIEAASKIERGVRFILLRCIEVMLVFR